MIWLILCNDIFFTLYFSKFSSKTTFYYRYLDQNLELIVTLKRESIYTSAFHYDHKWDHTRWVRSMNEIRYTYNIPQLLDTTLLPLKEMHRIAHSTRVGHHFLVFCLYTLPTYPVLFTQAKMHIYMIRRKLYIA